MWKLLRFTPRKILDKIYGCFEETNKSSKWMKPNGSIAYDTGAKVYNCVAGEHVPLIVQNKNCVTWYTCGPTVYDEAHIGHAICYMKCDIIQRILRHHFHINLVTAMNITDIDDKIIARSISECVQWDDIAKRYETRFWNDMKALGIREPDIIVRVSEFMPQIIEFVSQLLAKKAAYIGSDGSVYFRNSAIDGKLGQTTKPSSDHSKLNNCSQSVKKSLRDFALWKTAKPNEPSWQVPWAHSAGESLSTSGRPGWHTECSVMASYIFGNAIDIHAGGIDLKFPHHECEELQSCAFYDQRQWVNYWIHIGHLVIADNIKMSKSLKNVINIREFLRHYKSDQFRMLCLMTSYHTHVQFDDDILQSSGYVLGRFMSFFQETEHFLENVSSYHHINNPAEILNVLGSTEKNITLALKNDFDTKTCILELMAFVGLLNTSIRRCGSKDESTIAQNVMNQNVGCAVVRSCQHFVRNILESFGLADLTLRTLDRSNVDISKSNCPVNTVNLINGVMEVRENILCNARETKNQTMFDACDQLRDVLHDNGLIIKDRGKNLKSSWHYDVVIKKKFEKN